MTAVAEDVLLARAYLSRVAEPGCVPLWSFVEEVGPLEAVAAIRDGSAPDRVRVAVSARCDAVDPEADLAAAERHGVRVVCPESRDWPHFALAALYRIGPQRVLAHSAGDRGGCESGELLPPIALWVKGPGELASMSTRSVAIVGARASTAYGDHVSADLAYGLAGAGVTVVSGGAYGIDGRAHRSALTARGSTVLISAGGLDRPYPAGHGALFDAVAEAGLLVSESPPGAAPQRHRFLSRNRLIAAFATGTVVVEAALRSGAANTAAHATAMGRPVMAVPGPVTSPMSSGCHALLRKPDTILVSSVADVLSVVGAVGDGISESAGCPGRTVDIRAELDSLDPVVRRVFDGLPARRAALPDEIALRSGVPVVQVIRALPMLDLAGLLEVSDAGYRIPRRVKPSKGEVST